MGNNFGKSYIERDLDFLGGSKVTARVFDDLVTFEGIIISEGEGYKLAVDIVPDQSRIFEKVEVRVDGLPYEEFQIVKRQDDTKVVRVFFELDPLKEYINDQRQIDLRWKYTDEDLTHSGSTTLGSIVEIVMGGIVFTETVQEDPRVLTYSADYEVQKGDWNRTIGDIKIEAKKPGGEIINFHLRNSPDYINHPDYYVIQDFSTKLDQLPFLINKKLVLDYDSLTVQSKMYELIWTERERTLREIIKINVNTTGWAGNFIAPLPVSLSDSYTFPEDCKVARKFSKEPNFRIFYKAEKELKGQDLKFSIHCPFEELNKDNISVKINLGTKGYAKNVSMGYGSRSFIHVPATELADAEQIVAEITYKRAGDSVTYYVHFTELF